MSNTAKLEEIESTFNRQFIYPKLYKKELIINGFNENILPIIKAQKSSAIEFGIWGLLPETFTENWTDFQKLDNTLNIPVSALDSRTWSVKNIHHQKCVVIVSGFFSTFLYEGEIYPYYVYQSNKKPFGLASVYSQLSDGFVTFGILTDKMKKNFKGIHNISDNFPVAIDNFDLNIWLESNESITSESLTTINQPKLIAHPISKEFYKNDVIYEDILKPINYKKLPILTLS